MLWGGGFEMNGGRMSEKLLSAALFAHFLVTNCLQIGSSSRQAAKRDTRTAGAANRAPYRAIGAIL
jgi:hypothetical protein